MTYLTVIAGPMFSGKSNTLIERAAAAAFGKKSIVIALPATDTRKQRNILTKVVEDERLNNYAKLATGRFSSLEDLENILGRNQASPAPRLDLLIIDEAHFIGSYDFSEGDKIYDFIYETLGEGTDTEILIAGLDLDSDKRPYNLMPYFLALAHRVEKTDNVFCGCGAKARLTFYKHGAKPQTLIGDTESYEARCWKCHKPNC